MQTVQGLFAKKPVGVVGTVAAAKSSEVLCLIGNKKKKFLFLSEVDLTMVLLL